MSKRAYAKLRAASDWYIANCGESFSVTLHKNVNKGMEQIRRTPTIGVVMKDGKHRAYIPHKKSIIVYHYTSRTLYVDDLVLTDTHKVRLF